MKLPSPCVAGLLLLLTLPIAQAGPHTSPPPTERLLGYHQEVVCVHVFPRPYFALFVSCGARTASVEVTPGGVKVCADVPVVACNVKVMIQKDLDVLDILGLP